MADAATTRSGRIPAIVARAFTRSMNRGLPLLHQSPMLSIRSSSVTLMATSTSNNMKMSWTRCCACLKIAKLCPSGK